MNDYPNTHIQLLKTKYTTLRERLQKRLHNGEFSRFTQLKQQALFRRLQRYERQLKQWGIAIATSAALLLPATSMSGQVIPTGNEFRINTFTANTQLNPSTAMDMNGNFVVTWEEVLLDASGSEVYAQRYNSAGVAQGSEFRVNTYTTSFQRLPSVAMDSYGDFVISWSSALQDGNFYGVYAQRYDNMGIAQGSEFKVNTFTTGNQNGSSVAMDSDGDFVVTWESGGQDNSTYGIYAQRYNSAGVAQGSEFRVNTYTTSHQNFPSVAMDSYGDFVISWHSNGQDGQSHGIYAQRYNYTGIAQGSEFKVNTFTIGSQNTPSVAMDSDGDFVVTWQSAIETGGADYGIYAQRYNNSGIAQGGEFHVNTYTTNAQSYPAVAMDSDGEFVISWHSNGQDGSGNGVYAKRYNNTGIAQGGEVKVNTYTTNSQAGSSIAMNSGGDFVISWVSFQQVGSGNGIYAQRFITCTSQNWYADTDGDGYGAGAPVASCTQPPGMVLDNSDCNNNNNAVHPGAAEICNGTDDNCDNAIDNVTDEGIIFYHDNDMDGYGDPNNYTYACSLSAGFTTDHTDCNDNNAGINPGATEISGNNVDDNCNGSVDEIVLARIEYFFDADPGYGNGISVPISGNDVNTTFQADLSAVSTGVHFLYVRTQDIGGRWSETAFRVFYKPEVTTAENPALTRLEYFFDTDPGYGNGISVALSGIDVSTTFDLDLSAVSTGIHFLYIRTQDTGGRWSETAFRLFYKPEVTTAINPALTRLEYFFDTDPGYGNGISVVLNGTDVNTTFQADLSTVSTGVHFLYVRTQDSGGRWSETAFRLFYKPEIVNATIPDVVYIEYFLNNDPGYGNGISVPVTAAQDLPNFNFAVCLFGANVGNNRLFVRTQDSGGRWSETAMSAEFVVDEIPEPSATFYDDEDEDGYGTGTGIVACTQPVGTVTNNTDNCPSISNTDQANFDGDTEGDACDADDDNDGDADDTDCAPFNAAIHHSAFEICNNSVDDDCDVLVDENCNNCIVNIPDPIFKTALLGNGNININSDGEIQCSEAASYTGEIFVSNLGISDLTGIEAFTALTALYCYGNTLSSLDISANTALTVLDCSLNSLSSLDISNNTDLYALYCSGNNLITLDLSANTVLQEISCSENNLSVLDLSANTNLLYLECVFNNLTVLNVSANTALIQLFCYANQLTALDLSANTELTLLDCSSNQLTELNVQNGQNTNIFDFNTTNNPDLSCIQVDDVAYSTANWTFIDPVAYFSLDCNDTDNDGIVNALDNCSLIANTDQANFDGDTEGDACDADDDNDGDADDTDCAPFNAAIHHSAVEICNNSVDDDCNGQVDENCVICIVDIPDDNFKTALLGNVNININADLEIQCLEAASYTGAIDISYLSIADLTGIEAFTALTILYCNGNPLMSLDISANTALTVLDCSNNQLSSLDISHNTGLYNLYCSGNSLMTLNVSANTALSAIFCGSNQLSSLDLSAITQLHYLDCNSNQLSSLDLSANTELIQLSCGSNQLTSLNLSANMALTYLYCSNNQLMALNVQNGQNTNIIYFDAINNPGLSCILVDDVDYSTANWMNIDPVASFSLDCTDTDNDGDPDVTDCAPFNAAIYNNATEICNSIDDDCDGLADDGLTFINYYADVDGDGYGAGTAITDCTQLANASTNDGDCNDALTEINPGAQEICNSGVDDDCNAATGDPIFCNCYNALISATVAPSGTERMADIECSEGGWTHYFDEDGSNLYILLSIKKGGQSIGSIGDGTFAVRQKGIAGVSHIPNNYPINYCNTINWHVMNRYWDVFPTNQPSAGVSVRFYYTTEDFDALALALASATPPRIMTTHSQMLFYKVEDLLGNAYDINPVNGHTNIPIASGYGADGYYEYQHGQEANTYAWHHEIFNTAYHYGEYIVSKFSGGGGGGGNVGGAFPIELLSFTGHAEATANILKWVTATEKNSRYHIVERSLNGIDGWMEIGRVTGAGNSLDEKSYQLRDENPQIQTYYHLRAVDFDGAEQLSEVIYIERTSEVFSILNAFPVPVEEDLTLWVNSPQSGEVTILLHDVLGRLVYKNETILSNGVSEITIEMQDLPSGAYQVTLETGGFRAMKMVNRIKH